jgi:hypothetical protein
VEEREKMTDEQIKKIVEYPGVRAIRADVDCACRACTRPIKKGDLVSLTSAQTGGYVHIEHLNYLLKDGPAQEAEKNRKGGTK